MATISDNNYNISGQILRRVALGLRSFQTWIEVADELTGADVIDLANILLSFAVFSELTRNISYGLSTNGQIEVDFSITRFVSTFWNIIGILW